ncbi:MAG TPA: N-6 DNA methylase [Solirubrobacterales bacterium]
MKAIPSNASPLLSVSQIAELAQVQPSAVSNWRKRFSDFPAPAYAVAGARDLFELGAVEGWLKEHGRLGEKRQSKHLLWSAADLLRSRVAADSAMEILGAALALVALSRRVGSTKDAGDDAEAMLTATVALAPEVEDVIQPLRELDRDTARRVLALVGEIEGGELSESFEWLLNRFKDFVEHRSSDTQVALLLELIGEWEGKAIYDPAAGSGGFLAALWTAATGERPELLGQGINAHNSRIARQRFLIGDIPVSLATGDTLLDDRWPDLRADIVVCDPPYGLAKSWPASTAGDPRWISGSPPPYTDFAWLQHAAYHLADEGRAYVFLPLASLHRGGRERDLRRELLIEGAVEGIVGLPPRSTQRASVPLALWILRRPGRGGSRNSVLVVDAVAAVKPHRPVHDTLPIQRIAGILRNWRAGEGVSEWDRDLAAAVPVLDLLGGDASLVPGRWMRRELTVAQREEQEAEFAEALTSVRETQRALEPEIEVTVPAAGASPVWTPVSRLAEDGLVEVVRGTRVKSEDHRPFGVPVLRVRDVGATFADEVEPCFVEVDSMKHAATLTEPGDVVLAPTGSGIKAAVDYEGGRILAQPLQALRLLEGFMDPEVVAAFLQFPGNQSRMTGSARTLLRDLELPVLTPRESRVLRSSLDELKTQESLADELRSSVGQLRQALLSLSSSAAIVEGRE